VADKEQATVEPPGEAPIGVPNASLQALFRYLGWLGYDVHHQGLGRNRGKVAPWIDINLHKEDISPERGSPAPQPRDHR
jgi:hypothetical protein